MSKNKTEFSSDSLSSLAIDEVVKKMKALKRELFNLRFQKTLGELSNTGRFSEVKKNIARLKTELNKRKLREGSDA